MIPNAAFTWISAIQIPFKFYLQVFILMKLWQLKTTSIKVQFCHSPAPALACLQSLVPIYHSLLSCHHPQVQNSGEKSTLNIESDKLSQAQEKTTVVGAHKWQRCRKATNRFNKKCMSLLIISLLDVCKFFLNNCHDNGQIPAGFDLFNDGNTRMC